MSYKEENIGNQVGQVDQYGFRTMEDAEGNFRVYNRMNAWIGTFPTSCDANMYTYYRGKETNGL